MPRIILETKIDAPIYRVFDLARSIDMHLISFDNMREKVIAGRKKGLINEHEFVTLKARPFMLWRKLTSAITIMSGPYFFEDKMIAGPFSKLQHKHFFEVAESDQKTVMKDVFDYKSPLGPLGCLADKLFLKRYLEKILIRRNHLIKTYAENEEKWMPILSIY